VSGGFLSRDALLAAGPRGLPSALKRALLHLGFDDVRVVDGAGDEGADGLAVRDREQWVFQCKWSNRRAIDRGGVDDLERARTRYRADKAVLVTNTGLTRAAEQRRRALESVGIKISVWDGPTLAAIWERMPGTVPGDFKLRDYQRKAVGAILDDLRRDGRALLILATGLGKTVIGAEVLSDYLRDRPGASVLVVAHMKPLVEQLEQALARGRCHQNRYRVLGFFVPVRVVAESLLGNDLQVVRWPHGVGQHELAVTLHAQVCLQFFFRQMLETAAVPQLRRTFMQNISEKTL
jgi:hypothetical protein